MRPRVGGLLQAGLRADDCPSGKTLKQEIRERYWQGYEKRGR